MLRSFMEKPAINGGRERIFFSLKEFEEGHERL